MKSSRKPIGFTLVELLVVIAIIAILVSLLLPAVSAAREAARRTQCMNGIRNLALAVVNYESSKQKLPPSSQMERRVNSVRMYTGEQFSWIVEVLPFLEEQAIYDRIDFQVDVFSQQDADLFGAQPNILLCPSDAGQGRTFYDETYSNGRYFAKGNYAAYAGPEHITAQRIFSGMLIHEEQPVRRIRDGMSKTIMLTEVRTRDKQHDQRGAWAIAWTGTTLLALDIHSESLNCSNARVQTPENTSYIPCTSYYELGQPPNNPPGAFNRDMIRVCSAEDKQESDLLGMPCGRDAWSSAAPRSLHPGGVNAAFGDGSVRFVPDQVDLGAFAQQICIDDGRVIDDSSY